MVRPRSKELTQRELDVMHVFWNQDEATAEEARDALQQKGEELAYVTVANLIRGLADRGILEQTTKERPFRYRALKSFEEISSSLLGDLMTRLFAGSRQSMLVHLLAAEKLSKEEREYLLSVIEEGE